MITVTKIFDFELGHAIHGYNGSCRDIHGHSYKLFVTVKGQPDQRMPLPDDGFIIDFKILKDVVSRTVVKPFDHKLVLSQNYINANRHLATLPNLMIWQEEPSAENILLYIKDALQRELPESVQLHALRLHETASSYAEWID